MFSEDYEANTSDINGRFFINNKHMNWYAYSNSEPYNETKTLIFVKCSQAN